MSLNYAITVDEHGVITGVHESRESITADTFAGTAFEGEAVSAIPGGTGVVSGRYVSEYDDQWQLKSLAQRVAEGYVTVPEGYVVDGEDIRLMTPEERIAAGLDKPEPEPGAQTAWRIAELKQLLAATDYQVIKCYEYGLVGLDAPYDMAHIHAERQALRDEINSLEERE